MRIAVNTQHLLKDKLEGIGWFAHETLSRIVKANPQHEFLFIFDRKWDQSFIYADNVKAIRTRIPSRHPFLWFWHNQIDIPRIVKKYKADVFFSPDGWMPLNIKIPIVNVIHDINFIHRPKDLPYWVRKYYLRFFPAFAQKATRLITVSEFSKNDIVESLNIDAGKIDVAYNGCSPLYTGLANEVKTEIRKQFTGGKPYFIYVGSINPRKNIIGLLHAFEQFKLDDRQGYKMLFVGKPMWDSAYLSATLNAMKFKDDVIFTGRLSVEVLQMVLASAHALTMVSFFEGFGIPLVEAMYCDVPVISSNVTSLPEVAGEAAFYVDPNSTMEIANGMKQMALYPELRKSFMLKGKKQREKYSWDKTAVEVWKSIEKATNK